MATWLRDLTEAELRGYIKLSQLAEWQKYRYTKNVRRRSDEPSRYVQLAWAFACWKKEVEKTEEAEYLPIVSNKKRRLPWRSCITAG